MTRTQPRLEQDEPGASRDWATTSASSANDAGACAGEGLSRPWRLSAASTAARGLLGLLHLAAELAQLREQREDPRREHHPLLVEQRVALARGTALLAELEQRDARRREVTDRHRRPPLRCASTCVGVRRVSSCAGSPRERCQPTAMLSSSVRGLPG